MNEAERGVRRRSPRRAACAAATARIRKTILEELIAGRADVLRRRAAERRRHDDGRSLRGLTVARTPARTVDAPAARIVTVVPTPRSLATRSSRHSVRHSASRSSAPARCRSPWSRSTVRRSSPARPASIPTPVSRTSHDDRRRPIADRRDGVVDGQRAAARHRVQRVLDDVGQRAREERAVDEDARADPRPCATIDRDPAAEARSDTARRLLR